MHATSIGSVSEVMPVSFSVYSLLWQLLSYVVLVILLIGFLSPFLYRSMYLQSHCAGHIIIAVFFNGALIRTARYCVTSVANNARGHLLAELHVHVTPRLLGRA